MTKMKSMSKFNNEVFQNKMTDKDLDFDTKKHQPYFEFESKNEKVLIGLDDIMTCVAIAEKTEMIPTIDRNFWNVIEERYGVVNHEIEVDTSAL